MQTLFQNEDDLDREWFFKRNHERSTKAVIVTKATVTAPKAAVTRPKPSLATKAATVTATVTIAPKATDTTPITPVYVAPQTQERTSVLESGLKRKMDTLAATPGDELTAMSDSLTVLGLKRDGILRRLLGHLEDLDDDGFDELNDFQNRFWVHFCPSSRNDRSNHTSHQ